jgi:hypothetical protein
MIDKEYIKKHVRFFHRKRGSNHQTTHMCRTASVSVVDKPRGRQSDIESQAEAFRSCFEPDAFQLDENFSWMTESQREALGRKADEALKQAYIDQVSEMYGSAGNE